MSTNYFHLFKEDTIKLCKSLVIKSENVAEAINSNLRDFGFQVSDDPHRWKYYLNLAGEYHETDVPMTIVSLDTLETIDFTKANLEKHKTTRKQYTLFSSYYENLVARFPEQEALIRGIVSPVEISTAVKASDFTILSHEPDFMEGQEENLLRELQNWVTGFAHRYHVDGFNVTDDLYHSAFLGVMYLQLPLAVMNIRLANTHTEMVHSYHIWSYLASHSRLDDFRKFLTLEQSIWLYRNIRWLEANVGKQEVFEALVENMLTKRNLSLYGYNMLHDVSELDETFKPDTKLERFPINNPLGPVMIRTIREVLDLEDPLGLWNIDHKDLHEVEHTLRMNNSSYDALTTKVLESEATDDAGSQPFTLPHVLLNEWIAWSCTGRYTGNVTITNPFTNESMQLSARDAVIAYFYCYNKANGYELETMPNLFCHHIRRIEDFKPEVLAGLYRHDKTDPNTVANLVGSMPSIDLYTNAEDFYNGCVGIYEAYQYQRIITGGEEHFITAGEYKKIVDYCYCDYIANFEGLNLDGWMHDKGLGFKELSREDAALIGNEILVTATGAYLNADESLKDLQAAMVGIIKRLTSYDLQWIETTNEVEVKKLDWASIRGGDHLSFTRSRLFTDATLDRAKVKNKSHSYLGQQKPVHWAVPSSDDKLVQRVRCEVGVKPSAHSNVTTYTSGPSANVYPLSVEE